jgi:hypothetical protein
MMAASGTVICMRNVPEKKNPHLRKLTAPLVCPRPAPDGGMIPALIPAGFEWDGSSVPWLFQGFFPRHRHPIASCRHDWRCKKAKTPAERKWADEQFRIDVGRTSWWITKQVGYLGVRIGALMGIGVYNY